MKYDLFIIIIINISIYSIFLAIWFLRERVSYLELDIQSLEKNIIGLNRLIGKNLGKSMKELNEELNNILKNGS